LSTATKSAAVWIAAARLRTLPLALSGIALGSFLAAAQNGFKAPIALACFGLATLFQVLSNYANDYGDGVKGTDRLRVGEARMVASGKIPAELLKKVIWMVAALGGVLSGLLSYWALSSAGIPTVALFVLLGFAAVWAAMSYTMGRRAYGYFALGDLSVFLFFGWLSVLGSLFIQTRQLEWVHLLPASALGALSAGVLNLNNLRDIETDRLAGKRSLASLLGRPAAKIYQAILVFIAFDCAFLYVVRFEGNGFKYAYILAFAPILFNLNRTFKSHKSSEFDKLLKPLALSTLLFALLLGAGVYASL